MISRTHTVPFIFIDITKVAGTSIRSVLSKYGGEGKHHRIHNSADNPPHPGRTLYPDKDLKGFYTFSFIRNPWERILSLYYWGTELVEAHGGEITFPYTLPFSEYVRYLQGLLTLPIDARPMVDWFTDDSGRIHLDYLGRLDPLNLRNDWEFIANQLQLNPEDHELPHLYKTTHGDYRAEYNAETQKIVEDLYARDIRKFGYSFA